MTILADQRMLRAFVPSTALANAVRFDDDMMHVEFTDGRILGVPIIWLPRLHAATKEEREKCEIGGGGRSLHWEEIDEDLSIAGLMARVDGQSA